jgi:hemerythrin-like domain-containing protein
MRRHPALVRLSREHHHGLVMALRIERELDDADPEAIRRLYSDLIAFWSAGLLPHFRGENECLLARLVRHVSPEDELVRRTQRDHLGMEALVASMRDSEEPKARKDALRRFGRWLREHIRWEEEVLFEETQARLNEEELKALREQLDDQLPAVPASPWGTDGPPSR